MRVKKAVLLVLNNKTKGSVLSSGRLHGIVTPTKRSGLILSEGESAGTLSKIIEDIYTSSDQLTTILVADRGFADQIVEIDLVNLTFTKPFADITTLSDLPILAQGKGIIDSILNGDELQKDVIKGLADAGLNIDRFAINLNKPLQDVNLISEVLSKVISKAFVDDQSSSDIAVLTSSKTLSDLSDSQENLTVDFAKSNADVNELIERAIFSFSKSLSDNNDLNDSQQKSVGKVASDLITTVESPVLSFNKPQSDLLNLSDLIIRQVVKAFVDISSTFETTVLDAIKILSDQVNVTDTPQKQVSKIFQDAFSNLDTILVTLLKERTFTDDVVSVDDIVRSITKNIQDINFALDETTLDFAKTNLDINNIVEQLTNQFSKVVDQDFFSTDDTSVKDLNKAQSDSQTFLDDVDFSVIKNLLDTNSSDEQLSKLVGKILADQGITKSDTTLQILKALSDFTSFSDLQEKALAKSLQDDSLTIDQIIVTITLIQLLFDNVVNISTPSLQFDKSTSDSIEFSDVVERLLIINRQFREQDFQDYTEDETYFLEDYVRSGLSVKHTDNLITDFTKGLLDSNISLDQIIVSIVKLFALDDQFDVTDVYTADFSKSLGEDNVELLETPSKETNKPFTEESTESDDLSKSITKSLSELVAYQDVLETVLSVGLLFFKNVDDIALSADTTTLLLSKQVSDISFAEEAGKYLIQDYVGTYSDYTASGNYFGEDYTLSYGDYFAEDYVGKSVTFTSSAPTYIDTSNSFENLSFISNKTITEIPAVQYSDTINITKNKISTDVVVFSDPGSVLLYNYTDDISYFAEQYVGESTTIT